MAKHFVSYDLILASDWSKLTQVSVAALKMPIAQQLFELDIIDDMHFHMNVNKNPSFHWNRHKTRVNRQKIYFF